MKKGKITFFSLLAIFILIQFIPVNRPEMPETSYEFTQGEEIPAPVSSLLKNACYDCHSNQVAYPWYSFVAPVSWLVARDVRVGQAHLNFGEWTSLSKKDKLNALDDIADAVEEGEMPMKIYPILHPEARLTVLDRAKIVKWANEMAESVLED